MKIGCTKDGSSPDTQMTVLTKRVSILSRGRRIAVEDSAEAELSLVLKYDSTRVVPPIPAPIRLHDWLELTEFTSDLNEAPGPG